MTFRYIPVDLLAELGNLSLDPAGHPAVQRLVSETYARGYHEGAIRGRMDKFIEVQAATATDTLDLGTFEPPIGSKVSDRDDATWERGRDGDWRLQMGGDEGDAIPDQPDGLESDTPGLPGLVKALDRVNSWIENWGDGLVDVCDGAPLYSRDMFALTKALKAAPSGGALLPIDPAPTDLVLVRQPEPTVHTTDRTDWTIGAYQVTTRFYDEGEPEPWTTIDLTWKGVEIGFDPTEARNTAAALLAAADEAEQRVAAYYHGRDDRFRRGGHRG